MKTIKEQVGGRPLSAVTPEKKLMNPSSRPVVDGKAQPWVASVSPEATMQCIVEVGRASSLMMVATSHSVAPASPHCVIFENRRKEKEKRARFEQDKKPQASRGSRDPRSRHDEHLNSELPCVPL